MSQSPVDDVQPTLTEEASKKFAEMGQTSNVLGKASPMDPDEAQPYVSNPNYGRETLPARKPEPV